jgi:hypothetical protein
MGKTGIMRGRKSLPLVTIGICVAGVLALGGCRGTTSSGASPSAPGTRQASAVAAGDCNGDYCPPPNWDTAKAATPLAQIAPFAEPLNVVISARSTVSLTQLQQALGTWKTVSTATTVSITGIHLKCISSETADVTGSAYVPQHVAWRLGGCIDGNDLSLSGNEDHVRIWNQPVPGSENGAWFIAASYETMCLVKNGQLRTAGSDKAYAALHPGDAYHCVDGGPGSIATAHHDGYDDAARDFTAAIVAAARSKGWQVSQRTVTVKRGASSGEGGVPFSPAVSVVTLTA